MIDGQACSLPDAPVPIVYESPSAKYLIARFASPHPTVPCGQGHPPPAEEGRLSFHVGQRAPDVYFGADAADHLVREIAGCGVAAQVGGPNAV